MIDTPLRISRLHFPVRTLGPGDRIGIWFQGCSVRCPGCISLDTWTSDRGHTSVARVVEAIADWLPQASGFTISGGEPFDQAPALQHLLSEVRARHSGDVLVYSGHPVEVLPIRDFDGMIDALISDPLELDRGQSLPLRGSDNQRLHLLSPLGRERFGYAHSPCDRVDTLDVMFDDATGDVFLAGIPRRGDLNRLREILEAAGHRAGVTEDRRPQQ